jgi:hypothetical protein
LDPAVGQQEAEQLQARFTSLIRSPLPGLDVAWEKAALRGALYGTVHLDTRQQPFVLRLTSFGERLLVRCVSPVGRVGPDQARDEILTSVAKYPVRIGAVATTQEDDTYDLTVEGDVLLADTANADAERIALLVKKVTGEADALEQRHLPGKDEALATFYKQLTEETQR